MKTLDQKQRLMDSFPVGPSRYAIPHLVPGRYAKSAIRRASAQNRQVKKKGQAIPVPGHGGP
jgi:hypothetical protein